MVATPKFPSWTDAFNSGSGDRPPPRPALGDAGPRPGGHGPQERASDRAFTRAAAWLAAAVAGSPARTALAERCTATLGRPGGRLRTEGLSQLRPRLLDELAAFEAAPLGEPALAERALAGCSALGDDEAAQVLWALRLAPLRCYWVGSAIRRGCAWLYPLDDTGQLGERRLVDLRSALGVRRGGLIFGRVAALPDRLATQGIVHRLSAAALAFAPGDEGLVREALRLTSGAARWPLRVVGLFGLLAVRSGACPSPAAGDADLMAGRATPSLATPYSSPTPGAARAAEVQVRARGGGVSSALMQPSPALPSAPPTALTDGTSPTLARLYACTKPVALAAALLRTPLCIATLPHGLLLRAASHDSSGLSDAQLLLDDGEVWLCGRDAATLRVLEAAIVAMAPAGWRRLPLVSLDSAGRPLRSEVGVDAAPVVGAWNSAAVPPSLAAC